MKFKIGDAHDRALCIALKHEFLRCDDAFNDFVSAGEQMIVLGENRRIAYRAYNAYARFIHHLYEFMLAAVMRDRLDTSQVPSDMADKYLLGYIQRVLTKRRHAILNGTAPSWENHIRAYPEQAPPGVATEWRRLRNTISGHVKPERSALSLTSFYQRNHGLVYLLYYDCKAFWGRPEQDFPDLDEITAFTILLKASPSPPLTAASFDRQGST